MKCKKCSMGLSAGIAVGLWYVFGILADRFLPAALVNDWIPQIRFGLALAPISAAGDFGSLVIGLIQVFVMAFVFVRIACSINHRLGCCDDKSCCDSKKK